MATTPDGRRVFQGGAVLTETVAAVRDADAASDQVGTDRAAIDVAEHEAVDVAVPEASGVDHAGSAGATNQLAAVARGGALSLVGAVVSAGTNLALTVVIAHGVGRRSAGEFFALTSVFLLAETLCRLGADVGLIYFLSRWRAIGRFPAMSIGMRVALKPVLALSTAVGVGVFVFARPMSAWVGAGSSGAGLLRLLAVTLPVAVTYDICIAATRGWSRMRPTVFIDKIWRPSGQLICAALVLWLGWHALLGAAWALPYFIGAVAAARVVRKLPWRKAERVSAPLTAADTPNAVQREFWSFTAPRSVAAVAQLLLQRMDIVLVAALRGPVDAAVYTAATRFLVVGQFVNQALVAPSQPRLSAMLAARDFDGAREIYQATTSWLVLFVWPMYLGTAILAPVYLSVFGSGYHSGQAVVVLLCLITMVAACVGFVDVLLIMVGRTWINLMTTMIALALDAGLDIILIPRWGIVGAAVGWCGAIAASNLVPLAFVYRILRLHPFSKSTVASMLMTSVCFGAIPLTGELAAGGRQGGAVIGVLIGTVLYAGGLWRWRHRLQLSVAVGAIIRRKT